MLFQRFRRPRWQHKDPGVRREAVAALDTSEHTGSDVLERLATGDPDAGVRAAAIRRLRDLTLLRRCLEDDREAPVREGARARYRQLLAGGDELDDDSRREAIACCDDTQVLAHVARSAREEALRALALRRVGDERVLAEAALHDPVARLRQQALEQVSDERVLQTLAERGRRLDRRVARLARQRLDALAQDRAEHAERMRELVGLCERLEGLAAGPGSVAERQRLLNRGETIRDGADAELTARFERAGENSAARLAATASEPVITEPAVDDATAETPADVVAALEAAGTPTVELINRLETALAHGDDADDEHHARAWLEAGQRYLTLSWQIADADGDLHSLSKLCERLAWPREVPEPSAVAALHERLARQRERLGDHDADEEASRQHQRQQALTRLDETLADAETALEAGELKHARRAVNRVRRSMEAVPGSLDPGRERRVARTRAQLAELRDWRHFAVAPKQEALCESMEALGENDGLTPEARLTRIRDLHDSWKDTGGSDSARTRALWQRFQTATEQARTSCADWLEHEAARRERNREGRETVCSQLASFMDTDKPGTLSTRELDRIRRTARDDWQRFSPVDTRATRQLTRRFEALMDELSRHIDERREQARAAKQALVEEAGALLEDDDSERAAEAAKSLQQRWKAAGSARPGPERTLWREFRGACDQIFTRRDAARQARRAAGDERITAAQALCVELEALADEDAASATRDGLMAAVEALRQRLDTLELPEDRRSHGVRRRFERASEAVIARARRVCQGEALGALERAREAAVLCRDGVDENVSVGVTGLLDAEPRLVPVREALSGRLAGDVAALDESALRELCIRMEILAGVDSPAADRERRMALQVERLSHGMTRETGGERASPTQVWELVARWYGQPQQPGALESRFHEAARTAVASDER